MNLVNGAASDAASATDRGLAYGDGIFRTLLIRAGRPVWWRRHAAKLASDCAAVGIACPRLDQFERDLGALARETPDCVIKIIVTRGSGPRGYAPPVNASPTRIVTSSPLPAHPRDWHEHGVHVHLCRLRLARQPVLAGIKHLNRLEQVLARAEWNDPAVAEGLLCDTGDLVIGGTMTNVVLVRQGALVTPDLTSCGVAGVTRGLVLELARENGVATHVQAVSIDDLLGSDEVFLINSVIGVWPVAQLDCKTWPVGPVTAQVRKWLQSADDR